MESSAQYIQDAPLRQPGQIMTVENEGDSRSDRIETQEQRREPVIVRSTVLFPAAMKVAQSLISL
jgi:hypothetical protein